MPSGSIDGVDGVAGDVGIMQRVDVEIKVFDSAQPVGQGAQQFGELARGSLQVPGNGQPIVLMPDRGTSGGYPKIATVISADFGRFAQTPAGRAFRFKAVSMAEAQAAARQFAELLHTLPDRLRGIENFDLNIEALRDANVAGHAVSAVDAATWQVASPADVTGPD